MLSSMLLLATKLSLREPQVTSEFFKKKQSQEIACGACVVSLRWDWVMARRPRMDGSPAGAWLSAAAFQTLKGGAQSQGPDALLGAP